VAPRALLLIRVSKERDGMTSPEIQETSSRDYCAGRGYQVVDVMYGLDQSGSRAKSAWWPTLDRAVAAVEAGEYDVVVVWKFSRTARHRLRWAVALDRIESAGGRLESATEQFDTTNAAGRFARGMVAEMNVFQAEMIGEGWTETHERRVRSGRPHTGKPKWGYVYDPEQKLHVRHPEQGPVIADLYRRYIAGESIYALVRWLNAHGWRTLRGGLWSAPTLRRVLDSGFASGRFVYRGEFYDGVHEPLINEETWQAYLDARAARRQVAPRVERSTYLLSGLVRCASCGGTMTAHISDPGTRLSHRKKGAAEGKRYSAGRPRLKFRCRGGHHVGPARCVGGYVSAAVLEEHVLGYLRGLAADVEGSASAAVVAAARRSTLEAEVARLAREAQGVEDALVRLAVQDAERPLPPAVYAASRAQLEERAAELGAALEAARAMGRRTPVDPARSAAGLLEEWEELPVVVKREVLRGLVDCVLVGPGRVAEGRRRVLRVVEWVEVRA
jgi:DNA invertase Pin-like site-specific DNA recombinase